MRKKDKELLKRQFKKTKSKHSKKPKRKARVTRRSSSSSLESDCQYRAAASPLQRGLYELHLQKMDEIMNSAVIDYSTCDEARNYVEGGSKRNLAQIGFS